MNNSNIDVRSSETFLLSVIRFATISVRARQLPICGASALQKYIDAKSFRLRDDEPRVTECAPLAVARSSPYLRHALTAPLGQQATSHARHTWLLADSD
jgi:hypothetical protein